MRNVFVFLGISLFLAAAMAIGINRGPLVIEDSRKQTLAEVPCIGNIEVLNGCGIEGAAIVTADYLRSKKFDVKNIGNAQTWNYPYTMVISRTSDMTIANAVAKALKTDKVLPMKTPEWLHDITVVIGPDYAERIR